MTIPRTEAVSSVPPIVAPIILNVLKDGAVAASGVVEINDLKGVYNAKQHPDVKSGRKTEDEILAEFLDTFEIH